jgi:hypothetical protein
VGVWVDREWEGSAVEFGSAHPFIGKGGTVAEDGKGYGLSIHEWIGPINGHKKPLTTNEVISEGGEHPHVVAETSPSGTVVARFSPG